MRQDLAQRDRLLSGAREFRPQTRDRRVEIDLCALDQAERHDGAQRLADREEVDQRVAPPGRTARPVAMAAPEIGDHAAADRERDRSTRLAAAGEILRERLAQAREAGIAEAVDDTHIPSIAGSKRMQPRAVHLDAAMPRRSEQRVVIPPTRVYVANAERCLGGQMGRLHARIVVLAAILCGFGCANADVVPSRYYRIEGGQIGYGVNSSSMEPKINQCVSLDAAPADAPAFKSGSYVTARIVTKYDDLYDALDISGSARYAAVGGEMGMLKSRRLTSEYISVVLSGAITGETARRQSHLVAAYLSNLKDHPAEFQKKCGDFFISHIRHVTPFYLVFEVKTSAIDEISQLTGGASAQWGVVSAKISVSQLSSILKKSSEIHIENSNLPDGLTLPSGSSAGEWFTFTQAITANLQQKAATANKSIFTQDEYQLARYSDLPEVSDFSPNTAAGDFVRLLDGEYTTTQDDIARLEDFIDDPSQGLLPVGASIETVKSGREALTAYLGSLSAAMRGCSDSGRCSASDRPEKPRPVEVYTVARWIDLPAESNGAGQSVYFARRLPGEAVCVRARGKFEAGNDGNGHRYERDFSTRLFTERKESSGYFRPVIFEEKTGKEGTSDAVFGYPRECEIGPKDEGNVKLGIQPVPGKDYSQGAPLAQIGAIVVPASLLPSLHQE